MSESEQQVSDMTGEGEPELPVFEAAIAYESKLLVQSPSPADAAFALFLRRGQHRQFTLDEKKAYINIYDETGRPVHMVGVEQWLQDGLNFTRGVLEHCEGLANEHGLAPDSKEWREFIAREVDLLHDSCGYVA